MKKCNRCEETLPLSEFYKEKRAPDGHYARCKMCHIAQVNKKLGPVRQKTMYRRPIGPKLPRDLETYYPMSDRQYIYTKYGLNHKQFEDLYTAQGGRCAICGVHEDELSRRLHIDHCHDSLKVRGLLCHHCNTGIGMLKDDVALLNRAIAYIKG